MNRNRIGRLILPVIFVLAILALQATALTSAKAPLAPAGVTPTPTGQEITNTPDPGATPHPRPTKIPPGPRPVPGGPGNLGSILLIGFLVVSGLALVVTAMWYLPRLNRHKS